MAGLPKPTISNNPSVPPEQKRLVQPAIATAAVTDFTTTNTKLNEIIAALKAYGITL